MTVSSVGVSASASPSSELADLAARFRAVREQTERLAAPLSAEDQVVQSMPDVSPTKWHRAHTTWFFEEFVLSSAVPDYVRVNPSYRYLFNSYYEAVGARQPRPRRGMITRPSVAEVSEYRRQVDAAMDALFDSFGQHSVDLAAGGADLTESSRWASIAPLIELGTHHEQQHQELLLMDIKHVLFQNPLLPTYEAAPLASVPPTNAAAPLTFTQHDGGLVEIGHDGDGFSYDNEGPRHKVWLEPFALANRLVTCGEWLEFMNADGYSRHENWLSDGWATVQQEGWDAPLYWDRRDGEWFVFTLNGQQRVDPSAPVVNVSYYEADAYARWAGHRLPREQEWEAVAAAFPVEATFALQPRAATGSGMTQLYGEVWQWTSSAYSAYPGFSAAEGAVGEYNGKFMVDQQVLRGSASITADDHARLTYRNFFPSSSRWAFSGVRLASDA